MPPKTTMATQFLPILISLSLMLGAGAAWSGQVTVPNDFVGGTQAVAADVNANFDAVEAAINDNDTRIGAAQATAIAAQEAAAAAAMGHTLDTNTQLTETQVDDFVSNNGFGLAADVSDNADAIAANHPASASGFEDCGNGTVADNNTGLLWEQKTGSPDFSPEPNTVQQYECFPPPGSAPGTGDAPACSSRFFDPDLRDVNSRYSWPLASPVGPPPPLESQVLSDGWRGYLGLLAKTTSAYIPFYESLGSEYSDDQLSQVNGCFAGFCDWRAPTVVELLSIQDCSFAGSPLGSCIDPVFGPTAPSLYLTSVIATPRPRGPPSLYEDGYVNPASDAFAVPFGAYSVGLEFIFGPGTDPVFLIPTDPILYPVDSHLYFRAVRAGSCAD